MFQRINISTKITKSKYLSLRQLESGSFCLDIYESFNRNKRRRLSHIFDLNYTIIHDISIALAFVHFCAAISFVILNVSNEKYIFFIFLQRGVQKLKKIIRKKHPSLYRTLSFIIFLPWIAKFVLSLILLYFIEKGAIEKYNDFLECKYVKKSFFKKFTEIEKLRDIFIAFAFTNLVSEIVDKALQFIEVYGENRKKEEEEDRVGI